MLARTFEEAGLSTILVTNMPFWAELIGVPRTLAVEFPFGHVLGNPGNIDQQLSIIKEALNVLEYASYPGTIFHSEKEWNEPLEDAIRKWQPEIASPVVAHISGNVRELIRKSRE